MSICLPMTGISVSTEAKTHEQFAGYVCSACSPPDPVDFIGDASMDDDDEE